VPAYSQWSAVHKWAEVDSRFPDGRPRRARMGISAAGLTDTQVLDFEWSAHGVTWSLVNPTPQQRTQRGGYSITRGDGVSHVHCELHIDPAIPLPGLIVRQIMKRALAAGTHGLKRRVESLR
jgi:hypothetical protein